MYQGTNKTALSSQTQIANALIGLMKETPYAQISISQICRQAEVSRQTFYSLFSSKDKVIVYELEKKYCIDLEEEHRRPCSCLSIRDIALIYSHYIQSRAEFLSLLSQNNMLSCMTDSIYRSFYTCDLFMPALTSPKRNYLCHFIASGLTSIAHCYITDGERLQQKELAELICKLFSGELF